MSLRRRVLLALAIVALFGLPPPAIWWEASLVRHMLVQIPALVAAGFAIGARLPPDRVAAGARQADAVAAVLVGLFVLAFWMLPRWLDAAVVSRTTDAVKVASLILLAGVPLGWGWVRLGVVARGFVWVHGVTMLLVLGFLYLGYPDRLCNSYLLGEQARLGRGALLLAAIVGVIAVYPAFVGRSPQANANEADR